MAGIGSCTEVDDTADLLFELVQSVPASLQKAAA